MEKDEVREVVKETIAELLRQDRIKETDYGEATQLIADYYAGRGTPETAQAIKAVSTDAYFKIIPSYFRDGKTIEQLAIAFDCEVSTISRNKKRLCLEIGRRAK